MEKYAIFKLRGFFSQGSLKLININLQNKIGENDKTLRFDLFASLFANENDKLSFNEFHIIQLFQVRKNIF
jgi:hypothetical protein